MNNKILIIIFASVLSFGVPTLSRADRAIELIENELQNITISISSSTLHVAGANGEMLYIYNVAGVRVMSIKVDGPDKRYELNLPKGCYIVKVGKTVRKISIK